ncbi:MAG: DUF6112 family protein [Gemmatimonadales bacterium]
MQILAAIELGLFRLADISVKPNPKGLPGTEALEKLVNGLAAVALLGCGAAVVIGAAQWGLGQRANNYSQAADGKTKMLYGIGGAFVVGATSAIINFFYGAGSAVR